MECNKDEALRAKELAEKKMHSNDFLGAQKVALIADRLYPQLENISQLLTVCNVHCSGQSISTVGGSEKDWYGILQIDMVADQVTVKKQHRRLALVLHPDKNKFPGAEAAFKLIGEANMVLSDPTKRAMYDSKYRVCLSKGAAARRPSHQVNRNPSARQDNNIPNGFGSQFSNLNNIQKTQLIPSAMPETFWTGCPFCNIRYQYYRSFVNRSLRCQKCSKPFIAYDLGSQGAPLGPKWSQDVGPPYQQKEVSNQGISRMTQGAGKMGSQQGPMGSQPEVRREETAQVNNTNLKAKGKAEKYDKEMGDTNEGACVPKASKNNGKRSRKQTVESSERVDTSSCSTEPETEGIKSGSCGPRRSSHLWQHVSYIEGASDDENDLANPLRKVRANQLAGDDNSKQEEAASGDDLWNAKFTGFHGNSKAKATQNGTAPPKEKGQDKSANCRKFDKQVTGPPSSGVEKVEVIDSDSEPDIGDPPELYECPDPEFSDFDKHREESCFAVNQIWACYDTTDGMPRYYCQIRKAFVS
ncbi:putative aspartic proteinase-like protein 2-like [Capsicum annuum]|nr:putative aspartic proteinase-like protein 2-like [Capsicum annuum]